MQKGVDTYATVPEADSYISKHYLSDNPNRVRWNSLADEDKEVLLINACAEIETLPFHGRKAEIGQILSFPRLPYQYGHTGEGAPSSVKYAQIELALWLADDEKQEEYSQRKNLQEQGVKAFSVGDLSESYVDGSNTQTALSCSKVKSLLTAYLNGGYTIC